MQALSTLVRSTTQCDSVVEKVKFSGARNRRDAMFIVAQRDRACARETESNGAGATHFHCCVRAALMAPGPTLGLATRPTSINHLV